MIKKYLGRNISHVKINHKTIKKLMMKKSLKLEIGVSEGGL